MAFVRSSGRLLGSLDVPPPTRPGHFVRLAADIARDYASIWRSQPQVRTVVSFLSRNIAQLGLRVFERVTDTDRRRLTDHPLAQLLAAPFPRVTQYQLLDALVADLAVFDNGFWVKVDLGAGQPLALLRLPPRKVTPVGSDWISPAGYRFQGARGFREFPAEQVVHFHGYDPDGSGWGVSPIETLRQILAEEFAAAAYREQLWRNGARIAGYLHRPADAPGWSDGARERFRGSWQAQYTGDGPAAGGTPILEDGMTFAPAAVNPKEAQYVESRKLTREEVASAYHIPLPMVGILDHATFSNITEQHKQLYTDTLGPWLEQITQTVEAQLLPDLPDTGRVYVEFNMEAKLRGSFEEQAASLSSAVGRPWMTANEARARLNLPQLDDADDLVTPLNVLVGGQASPRDSAPEPEAAEPERAARRSGVKVAPERGMVDDHARALGGFFARQGRAVASRLGAVKARGKASVDEVYDSDRWQRELLPLVLALATDAATAAGRATMPALGGDPDGYDTDRTGAWLGEHAVAVTAAVDTTTRRAVAAALTDGEPVRAVRALFDAYATQRAPQIAQTEATAMAGWGSEEAARQTGQTAVKTWRTGAHPRSTHARLNGQTVAVGEVFSNGARWPGDSRLPEPERAGCNCHLDITTLE